MIVLVYISISPPSVVRAMGGDDVEWIPRFEEQVVYEGDLILQGNDELVIENITFILDGTLLVRDNAKFIIKNGELYIKHVTGWDDFMPYPFLILFNDSATFEAEGVKR
jgi:hypothetical protein